MSAAAKAVPVISKNATKRAAKRAARAAAKLMKSGHPPLATDLLPLVDKRSPACKRFRVLLRYDGTQYHGWQQQNPPGKEPLRTVAGVCETAFRTVLEQRVRVHPSGRTDAGVSAERQVCQFDAVTNLTAAELPQLLNAKVSAV